MSHACVQWRGDIGACILGALDGLARARLTRHLTACASCRAEYEELVPVRDWLGLLALPADQPDSLTASGSGDVLVPARHGTGRRVGRPRTWRTLPAAVAAAACAAACVIVALLLGAGTPAPTYRAANSTTGISGHAQLHGTPTGTQIDLTASGLPRNERCILVAVTRGATDIAGSWGPAYNGSAHMTGTTAFPASQLTALRIESDTGILLLTIRL